MSSEFIILTVQIIAALGVFVSMVFLGLQIRQQNIITKAQFGHILTQRLYDRYFQTSKDQEYAEFMSKDWNSDNLTPSESWRIQMAILTYLVDIFDVYDKVNAKLVDKSHLDTRMRTLKLGVMKTTNARLVWSSWKRNRSEEFIKWFEDEIYLDEDQSSFTSDELEKLGKLNTRR